MDTTRTLGRISPAAAATYRECARAPATLTDVAARLDTELAVVADAVGELRALGLVGDDAGGVIRALAPVALDREIDTHERLLRDLRRAADELAAVWLTRGSGPAVDIIEGPFEAVELTNELMASAHEEVVATNYGAVVPVDPLVATPRPAEARTILSEPAALERGVSIRAVYDSRLLTDPGALSAIHDCVRAGEKARTLPGVPMSLSVYDQRVAALSGPGVGGDRRHLLVTRHRGFVAVFQSAFEFFWRAAMPVVVATDAFPGEDGPDGETRRLLAHLAAGITDEVIGRDLGVSARTVGRRIARLQDILGAGSRFQLALQASRRGWV